MDSEDVIVIHLTCSCEKHSVLRILPKRLYDEPKPRITTIPSNSGLVESTSKVIVRLVRAGETV